MPRPKNISYYFSGGPADAGPPEIQVFCFSNILFSADPRICGSAISAGRCVYNNDLVHGHAQNGSQNDQVVDGRQGCAVDPLVDSLRCSKTKHFLYILYGKTGFYTHAVDVLTGRDSVDVRVVHKSFTPCPAA